jgi:hypothetical protein
MELLWEYKRSSGTITAVDFEQFPIWTLVEDDNGNSFEVPVIVSDPLYITDDDLVIFVYCHVWLSDGTKLKGIVYIDLVGMREYGIILVNGDKEFTLSSINARKILNEGSPEQLSNWLNKPIESISPIAYTTSFHLHTGKTIEGVLDLHTW